MKFWFVVAAAGVGKRFGHELPKQYLELAGKKVIEHTLERLLALQPSGIAIAINEQDQLWPSLAISRHPLIRTVPGGAERADSVRSALQALKHDLAVDDWLLVHDVARPCITESDLSRLIAELACHEVGGLLAAPVSDTLKRIGADGCSDGTEDRAQFWAAMTPQMFRYGLLLDALIHCQQRQVIPTDEAMAIELLGLRPKLVVGRRDNIKITTQEDMAIAETILRWQQLSG